MQIGTVINQTRNNIIANRVELANTYFERLVGLMGRAGLERDAGLWIVPCRDIHSCLMRFPFDALFINKKNQVVDSIHHMKPWRISRWVRQGHAVLELAVGRIAETETQLGDQVLWKP